jgi:hypothetical protein
MALQPAKNKWLFRKKNAEEEIEARRGTIK